MAELLIGELGELNKVGLQLNADKSEILHISYQDEDANRDFCEIHGEFVKILHGNASHKYLGRTLSLSASTRTDTEFDFRCQQAWASFHKHKKVILNKHVSLEKRLRFFDVCVSSVILFGLVTFPLIKQKLKFMDQLQRKMMRRIVGWSRIENEPWRDTMIRMNGCLTEAEQRYRCQS